MSYLHGERQKESEGERDVECMLQKQSDWCFQFHHYFLDTSGFFL